METEITKRIRALRKQKGLSAGEVAQKLGISRPFYSLLEGGKRRLSAGHVEKIARILGVPVSKLFGEAPPSSQEEAAKADKRRPFKHLRQINTPELRKQLEPLLGNHAEDFMDCFHMYARAPGRLKRVLQAFYEENNNAEDK